MTLLEELLTPLNNFNEEITQIITAGTLSELTAAIYTDIKETNLLVLSSDEKIKTNSEILPCLQKAYASLAIGVYGKFKNLPTTITLLKHEEENDINFRSNHKAKNSVLWSSIDANNYFLTETLNNKSYWIQSILIIRRILKDIAIFYQIDIDKITKEISPNHKDVIDILNQMQKE